jgi:uncharacterized protein (TIGR02466 family)
MSSDAVVDNAPTLTADQLHALALDRHRAGDLPTASQFYVQALAAQPDYAPALHMSGTLAFQQGDLTTALNNLQRAIELGHQPPMVWWHYGCVLLANKKAAEAVKAFRAALEQQPGDAELLLNLGTAAHQAAQGDVAIPALQQAAAKLDSAAAYYALGLALQEFGQRTAASTAYAAALKRDPLHADAALNAGVLAHEVGDLPRATLLYRQALSANSDLTKAAINLAAALQDQGDLESSVSLLQQILAKTPEAIEAWNNLGSAQQRLGDDVAAENSYRAVLARDPFHAAAMENLASTLRRQGKTTAILDYPKALAQQKPEQPQSWLALARALEREGNYEEERAALWSALKLDPSLASVHDMLGTMEQVLGDLPAAFGHYRQAVALVPHDIEYRINLGLAAVRLRDFATALPALDAVLAINRFDQRAIAYRALALRLAGDVKAANALTDPEALTTILTIPTPAGYSDVPHFLNVLVEDLRAVKDRSWSPYGQSVRGGSQTENMLFADKAVSIQAFRGVLDQTIHAYLQNRRRDDSHPFLASRPERLQYRSWSVILRQGGYHIPHIHPGGSISGVFYVAVPNLVGHEGWLELGVPGIDVMLPAAPPCQQIQPVPGRLVLFPSYMWHGTVPFTGDGERITIAFDVVQV